MKIDDVKGKAKRLIDVCEKHLKDDDVQAGFPMWNNATQKRDKTQFEFNGKWYEVTWCHLYAYKVFKELGYNIDCLLEPVHKSIDWTTPIYMYDKALALSALQWSISGVKILSIDDAQTMANNGVPILVMSRQGVGHAGILAPNDKFNEPNKSGYEPIIYNAGSREVFGKKSLYDTFLKYEHRPVFFQIQKSIYK